MISKEDIKEFFEDIKNVGDFDTTNKLLWGYFFLSNDTDILKKLSNELVKEDYKFVDIFLADKINENDPTEYYLHLEKVEYHNVNSLDIRTKELYNLAEKYNVIYDGFDLGNILTSENILK